MSENPYDKLSVEERQALIDKTALQLAVIYAGKICAGCGSTANLEVTARPGSTYHLCAGCLKEEEMS